MLLLVFIAAITAGCQSSDAEEGQKASPGMAESEKVTLPQGEPALIGKVKEIIGNEVTVYIAQAAQNGETDKPADQTETQNQEHKGERTGTLGGEVTFSEETETFLIPVGVPMVAMQSGRNEAGEIELTKITADAILRIWKTDGAISFVQVTNSNKAKSTGQNQEKTGQGTGNPPDMGGPPPGM
ncbi:hypothetical protein V6C32_18310 [Desulforamulus ruminis]